MALYNLKFTALYEQPETELHEHNGSEIGLMQLLEKKI